MGNLHTTDVLLRGSPELVELESLKAIRDAGEDGGFILSTGDQVGRDTPFENIKVMKETCEKYGYYDRFDLSEIYERITQLQKDTRII